MSRRAARGPIAGLRLGWGIIAAALVTTTVFGLAWRFVPIGLDTLVVLYVLALGGLVGTTLVSQLDEQTSSSHSRFEQIGRRASSPSPGRVQDLAELEALFASATRYEHGLYLDLRSHLRYVAHVRLAARGIDLENDPRARDLLGELYEVVGRRPARAGALVRPGVPVESLAEMVATLERL